MKLPPCATEAVEGCRLSVAAHSGALASSVAAAMAARLAMVLIM